MSDDPNRTDLDAAVVRRRTRSEQGNREGERPLARNLALAGTLGWLVVVPMLGGAFVGRWLDGASGMGIAFTSALMSVGTVLGCWLAWKRVHSS